MSMSLRAAINEKCRGCIYDSEGRGTWREQVGQCTIVSCSLWKYRPQPSSYRRALGNADGAIDTSSCPFPGPLPPTRYPDPTEVAYAQQSAQIDVN